MNHFEASIDRKGNMLVANGWVWKHDTQQLREAGADSNISLGPAGISLPGYSGASGIAQTGPSGVTFVGGSGRLLIATASTELSNPPGENELLGFYSFFSQYEAGPVGSLDVVLYVDSATVAEIYDNTGTIANWVSGDDAPLGTYEATTYGKNTYNGGNAFNIVVTAEGSRLPQTADVEVSAGTAQAGEYSPTSDTTFSGPSGWSIQIVSGYTQLSDGTDVVASANALAWDDPSGILASTSYGATNYNSGEAFTVNVTQRNAYPRSGYVVVKLTMDGTSLESVSAPYFVDAIPAATSTEKYVPLFYSNGSSIAQQLHTGMILI